MFPSRRLGGASTLVLCSALSAIPPEAAAQAPDQTLPTVNIEAPKQHQAAQPAKRPPQRTAVASRQKKPPPATAAKPAVAESDAGGVKASLATPPIKQRFQLPQESFSITAKKIDETINLKDPEDAIKYFPSLFVRKRNDGDNQAVLATRTWGLNCSACTLIYYDDLLISALIGNNNSGASPHWNLISPDAIARIDFLDGPFAAAYPGNSIGGVLLITSKMPDHAFATVKQTVSVMPWNQYGTKDTYASSVTSASAGNRDGNLSWLVSANYLDTYQQPLTYTTNGSAPVNTAGTFLALNKQGVVTDVVGTGTLAHSQQTSGNVRLAYDISPLVQATYSLGVWNNVQTSNPQTYLTSTVNGSPTFGNVAGFASNKYVWDQTHLSNAISLKSDTKGTYDFDFSASTYNYLQDIMYNPYTVSPYTVAGGVVTSQGNGYSENGKVTRNDGTNWQNVDAKGIWRPYGYDGPHEISFGIHGDRYDLENPVYLSNIWNATPATGNGQLFSDGVGETRTGALWAQDAWKITSQLKLTLGAREEVWQALDGFNVNSVALLGGTPTTPIPTLHSVPTSQPGLNSANFSPKASLSYDINKDWNVTGNFGEAYRFPTVTELYQNASSGTTLLTPNPNLTPEQDLNGEFVVERHWSDGKVRLTLFREHVNNAIISQTNFVTGSTTNVTTFSNVGAIRMQGVELAADKDNVVIKGLEVFGSVTYVDSRILSDSTFVSNITNLPTNVVGNRVPYVPDWRAKLGATYRPNDKWAFTFAARYSGKQYSTLDNSDIVSHVYGAFDNYIVADLKVHYNATQNFSFDFGIDNLFNEQYFLFHPFPGRTFVLAGKYTF
ncbi:MAG TPA: TonB-dependent receptor [Bradyrhizobium sp.]|jgi:iron complex outermembrane receptor protein|uniref:TonB-dependent receptor n=1 Tax=Bradyrhizobium sp. TaxID=376 RepID=UPI002D1C7147|nr:TonB-dependent receptor [Bradyrhizobium sp.]HTA99997.1 TonB-dependent receptor [Bradyrhizobium sp.]